MGSQNVEIMFKTTGYINMNENIILTVAPKHILNKIKWKLVTEFSNLLCFTEVQSLAASELPESVLKINIPGLQPRYTEV